MNHQKIQHHQHQRQNYVPVQSVHDLYLLLVVGFRQVGGLGGGGSHNVAVVDVFGDEDEREEGEDDDFGGEDAFDEGGLFVGVEVD